jgi:hypothetical protein
MFVCVMKYNKCLVSMFVRGMMSNCRKCMSVYSPFASEVFGEVCCILGIQVIYVSGL